MARQAKCLFGMTSLKHESVMNSCDHDFVEEKRCSNGWWMEKRLVSVWGKMEMFGWNG